MKNKVKSVFANNVFHFMIKFQNNLFSSLLSLKSNSLNSLSINSLVVPQPNEIDIVLYILDIFSSYFYHKLILLSKILKANWKRLMGKFLWSTLRRTKIYGHKMTLKNKESHQPPSQVVYLTRTSARGIEFNVRLTVWDKVLVETTALFGSTNQVKKIQSSQFFF